MLLHTLKVPTHSRVTMAGRNGITLLEVLISIGILSIGLMSVAALIPAGKAQAAKATVADRAAILAANALADAVTFGLLRPAALSSSGTVTIDAGSGLTGVTPAWVRSLGIYSSTSSVNSTPAFHAQFLQSRDDILLTPGATDDDLPTNLFIDGLRAFDGRMTCMYLLASGTPARLSAVVFRDRDPAGSNVSGQMTDGVVAVTGLTNLGDRSAKDVLKTGCVLFANGRLHQVLAAAYDTTASQAFVTLSTGTAATVGVVNFELLPDSVGLAETTCRLESSGPYLE